MIYYLNFEKPVDYPGCGEPDFASACRRGKVPTGPLEKLGTDCDDRKRKYSLPRINNAVHIHACCSSGYV